MRRVQFEVSLGFFDLWIYKLHHFSMSSCIYILFKYKIQSLPKSMQYPRPEVLKTEDFQLFKAV